MKPSVLLSALALALAGKTTAFQGQMAASNLIDQEGPSFQIIYLTDYYTGSTYQGTLWGGFNDCVSKQCDISFIQTKPNSGGYDFNARMWKTNNGCHNIDFLGALDAHHGYCCGSLPCNFNA
ncbi:hypothetical protein BDV12DRAFT_183340 [Aspergillus spectabilis]